MGCDRRDRDRDRDRDVFICRRVSSNRRYGSDFGYGDGGFGYGGGYSGSYGGEHRRKGHCNRCNGFW